MAVRISGVLKDGAGKPIQNCTIQLKARRNSTTVVVNTVASENPDEAGRYTMDVEYGQYSVSLLVEGFPPSHAGIITVYEDSKPGTLNDFLGAMTEDDARPEALRRFELMVEEVARNASVVAQNTAAAKKSASDASTSAREAATHATDAAGSARAASTSAGQAASSAQSATSSAGTASTKATEASKSASAAADSKTAAASSASAASTSAGQASASATAAGKSAESAASSASTATTKAGEATEQASAAARSASAAKTSETNAKASETSAESSKTAAASSASSAASSASSASASKDEATRQASAARGSATTASTKATEAAGSAAAAAQSKSTAESAATRAETAAKRAEDIASAVALEDASTTKKGIVQLSSATNSTSETLAATPKAVKAAYDNAEKRLQKDQNGADIPDKDRFLSNINVYSKGEVDQKKGMRKYTFSAPANAVSGKWYPIVFRRSGGSTDELASRVVITTYSSDGGYAMNNCEFNGFVMPGGWFDRSSYAAGFFSIYSTAERAIHSIISSVRDDDLCSVFYVEARAFPINIFAEEGLNVIVPTADYAVGQTTYKWGATDPLSESTNAQIILDFKNGRGYYCSHPFISSLSGNAATATKLQTACTINGVSFDGTKDITLTPKDLDAYSKSEVQSALAGKQPLDNTLTNLSGKDVAGLLAYLGLQTIKPDPVSTKIFSPDLKKFLLVSNTSWGMWNNDTGAAIALPVTQGGTGQTTVDGVKAAFGIDKLQPKGNYVITDASTKQSLSDALSCRYGLEVTDSNNIIRVGIYSTNNQATITGINGKAIIIPDKAGTMALAGESVSALRLSAPREVTVTTADAWMNFTTSEMVVGIYITPTPGGGAWVLNKVKVATLQAYINGAWVNVTQ